jgi:hypothetical protein
MRLLALGICLLAAGCLVEPDQEPSTHGAPTSAAAQDPAPTPSQFDDAEDLDATLDLADCSWWQTQWYHDADAVQSLVPKGYDVREPLAGNTVLNLVVARCAQTSLLGRPLGPVDLAQVLVVLDAAGGEENSEWNDFYILEPTVVDGAAEVASWFSSQGFPTVFGQIDGRSDGTDVVGPDFSYSVDAIPAMDTSGAVFARTRFRAHFFSDEPRWLDDEAEFVRANAQTALIHSSGGVVGTLTNGQDQAGTMGVSFTGTQWEAGPSRPR